MRDTDRMATESNTPDEPLDAPACALCGRRPPSERLLRVESVRPYVAEWIARHHADRWPGEGWIGWSCLQEAMLAYEVERLEEERGELSAVETEVARRANEHDAIARDVTAEFDRTIALSQYAADRLAAWGGSWTFVIGFLCVLGCWMVLNTVWLRASAFDPYPFILLNLMLSCIAALQAPVILMSQNRQTARDRIQADHDFRVNLKAEIEIASLHEKLDHLLHRQWDSMIELQQMQLDLLQQIAHDQERGRTW